ESGVRNTARVFLEFVRQFGGNPSPYCGGFVHAATLDLAKRGGSRLCSPSKWTAEPSLRAPYNCTADTYALRPSDQGPLQPLDSVSPSRLQADLSRWRICSGISASQSCRLPNHR